MKPIKISLDFDDTLSNLRVQHLAYALVKAGIDVHIVTSRMSTERAGNPNWNVDLELIAGMLEIPMEKVHYCNLKPKFKFFQENEGFVLHLDDDQDEVDGINLHSNTEAILFVDSIFDVSLKRFNELIY